MPRVKRLDPGTNQEFNGFFGGMFLGGMFFVGCVLGDVVWDDFLGVLFRYQFLHGLELAIYFKVLFVLLFFHGTSSGYALSLQYPHLLKNMKPRGHKSEPKLFKRATRSNC